MITDNTPWTPEETDIALDQGKTQGEVAKLTGHSVKAVKSKRERLRRLAKKGCVGFNGPKGAEGTAGAPDHKADKVRLDNAYWQGQYDVLNREYQKSLKQNVVVDRLIADVKELAPLSYGQLPKAFFTPRKAGTQTPESAFLIFSDTHIGKVIRKEQTLGFSEYSFPIFLARLKYLETQVLSILEGHTNAPISELVIAMIGDMLDGALQHGSEGGQRNVIFNQFYAGGHAIAQFLRNLAKHVPLIRIYTAVGNHTRFGTQKKMPTENRHSNFDQFLFAYIQALTADIPNIQWTLNEQPFAVFKVQGWNFFASHGDNLKGGDAAFGLPSHALARQLNATTQLFYKHGETVPDYYLTGHFHRSIQIPTGLGDITINGGFPGLDGYGLSGNFNPCDPTQTFFRCHPKFGKVAEYKISLKFADPTKPTYDLPKEFPCE